MSTADYQPFPNTHWSLIHRAGGAARAEGVGGTGADAGAARDDALAILLERYAPALRSYLRFIRRLPDDAADDLLQAFIADRLLASELLRSADATRGRFRTLLLTSLNNFATSRYRAGRRHAAVALDDYPAVAAVDSAPGHEGAVEAAWARQLVHQVIDALRAECDRTNRPDLWAVFEGRILDGIFNQRPPISYEELARRFGLRTPAQAANLLVTAKRMYARLLRAAIAQYERDTPDIEAEIAELRAALSHPEAAESGTGDDE